MSASTRLYRRSCRRPVRPYRPVPSPHHVYESVAALSHALSAAGNPRSYRQLRRPTRNVYYVNFARKPL